MPDPAPFRHSHRFNEGSPLAEKNTLRAVVITAIMMVVEIVGGYALNSMALLADGWHMSSHALALGVSAGAYVLARRLATDRRFAFGTWKIEVLGGYSSALLLGVVAALMLVQSVERLVHPAAIHYDQAIPIAVVGLLVNLLCAWLLKDGHHHHGHDHEHDHGHRHHDLNLRSAYLHVVADAATSVLAILALSGGKFLDISWLDPLMGIVGAVLVAQWAISLIKQSGRILLDADMDAPVVEEIRGVVADKLPGTAITDLHVWRVGKGRYACILALVTDQPLTPAVVRRHLAVHEELAHVTVEIAKADAPAIVFLPGNSAPDGRPVTTASASRQERSEGPGSPS
ncbi:CDF family Co(II)/Ni(II) efflux transporter DmeF [Fulvimonas sp. R45]|uniref:CDF family Co(II)/Ni(II) efflux transporter DmeF n=1 Tax=Fulvimonas sp. R45 TaxID=3045937 RepID=UPI0026601032|nr:CDF family Co(II)/Ni(II) efflux transporter DmeF [Fulvimonas sp. R45]MDO1529774.1 CDF family Co(II)/Ni(II) efflux transporter DmeF [Fulvimonas sp. R45]